MSYSADDLEDRELRAESEFDEDSVYCEFCEEFVPEGEGNFCHGCKDKVFRYVLTLLSKGEMK